MLLLLQDCEQALAEKAEIESRMREVEQALQESQKVQSIAIPCSKHKWEG